MAAKLRFYLDENVPVAVARQLQARGIETVTVRDLGLLGAADTVHLSKATADGFVFCTYDSDYLKMAAEGIEHAGIVFGQQDLHYIGDWVNSLSLLHALYTSDEMRNRIEFI